MSLFAMPSDAVYLQRLKRFQAVRRPFGVILLVAAVGLGIVAFSVWEQANPRQFVADGANEKLAYDVGFVAGATIWGGVLIGLQFAVMGTGYLVRDRKTELLIDYYERLQGTQNADAS